MKFMSTDNKNTNHLQELGGSDYKIAEGEDNIKGWDVKDGQGHDLGDVDELIFDTESLKVRYLVLDVDKNKDLGLKSREVLIPIGMAELDHQDNDVILRNITPEQIRSLPEYDKHHLNSDYEMRNYRSIVGPGAAVAGSDFYNNEYFDDRNLYKNRRNERREREIEREADKADVHNPLYDQRPDITDRRSDNITDRVDTKDRKYDDIRDRRSDDITDRRSDDIRDKRINADDETSIPVIEENWNVGKKEVEQGGIHLTSRVVENPVEKKINLREEHVKVERKPVNRRATDADFEQAHDQDFEVHEHKEVPVVNKEARVVEEVKLKKDITEHEEKIKETLRKTEVKVDELKKNK